MNKPVWLKDYVMPTTKEEVPFGASNEAGFLVFKNAGFRSMKPSINTDVCIKCMMCWVYCPEGCIDKTGETLKIDYDYCKGCGICAKECPKQCISMVKEDEA
ncbi:4Fe-4S binding protein [Chakrabartyella piscis]|uniref:4Fe-4S binding protein n=1 Tax=Chakrabartyella piscis TaxID=2918914 RepID=UPI0029588B52|nr:4Fe-4S binding protein [Chakrabartyella piscis]